MNGETKRLMMESREIESSSEYFLMPGYIFISYEPCMISTVVGSSVAVSLWDSERKLGGMSSFLYPAWACSGQPTAVYGSLAIPLMIKIFHEEGAEDRNLESQIFGGAESDFPGAEKIANENIEIARNILKRKGIRIVSEDVGGGLGRKIVYDTFQNEALIYKVSSLRNSDWYPYKGQGRQK